MLLALAMGAAESLAQSAESGPSAAVPQTKSELEAEYNRTFEQMLKNPADLDTTFHFAELATELGNYEAAISALERMLLFNPELPRVRFELGVLYFRLGSYDIARTYLTEARDAPGTPKEVQARANAFLAEIDKRASPHKFSGALSTGLRFQSDANAGSGPDVIANGISATLSSQFTRRPDWNAFVTGNGRYTYDLGTQNNSVIESDGVFYYSKQRKVGTVDLALAELNLGPRFDVIPGDTLWMNLRPYVLANDVFLDHEQYFYTLGSGIEASRPLGDRLAVDGVYEFRFKRFSDSPNQPTAVQLNSVVNSFALDFRYALLQSGVVGLGTSFAKEDAAQTFNSNKELDFRLNYTQSFDLPFSIPEGPLVVIPALYRIYTTYDDPDPSVDPTNKRVNQEWRWAVTAQLGLYKGVAANVQFMRQVVGSSLPNFKYNNTSVTLGLLWTF